MTIQTAIIGGGAAGLFLATNIRQDNGATAIFERGERLGKKLSATGNGQGNITHDKAAQTPYFSATAEGKELAKTLVTRYDERSLCAFFQALGMLIFFDEGGRGYPTGRQASAITDALRFAVEERNIRVYTNTQITGLKKEGDWFVLTAQSGETYYAKNVALCAGGKAAKNFGTDGTAYDLAKAFGHTLTPLYPSLVQLKTDTANIRTLKGIRVFDAGVTAIWSEGKERKTHAVRGDIIFTDYGVSGDAVFRLSAFLADKKEGELRIDFLPDVSEEQLLSLLRQKAKTFPRRDWGELPCGIVNNQLARAIAKITPNGDFQALAAGIKRFPLQLRGSLGFDYAQVTKGGISALEVDEHLQSKKADGLYFAGEILDIDGECGGFNLQWAYASARAVAEAIDNKMGKARG